MRKMAYTFAAILLAAVFGLTGCGGDFDAVGYMQAVLDERLQGEFSEAAQIMDTSEFELKQDYESSVDSFVYAYLTAGYEELNDYTLYEYETLVKDIFSVMKYDVKKAEKAGEKEYEVSVEIQPVDLFLNYVKELEQASDEIEESAKNGGYEGRRRNPGNDAVRLSVQGVQPFTGRLYLDAIRKTGNRDRGSRGGRWEFLCRQRGGVPDASGAVLPDG